MFTKCKIQYAKELLELAFSLGRMCVPTTFKLTPLQRAIESFQKGETPTFIEHIRAGIRLLEEQPNSMLVFSG